MIDKIRCRDKELEAKLKRAKYYTKYFHGFRKVTHIICGSDKIFMPSIIQKYAVKWYYKYLLHPGMDCIEDTIIQQYY